MSSESNAHHDLLCSILLQDFYIFMVLVESKGLNKYLLKVRSSSSRRLL